MLEVDLIRDQRQEQIQHFHFQSTGPYSFFPFYGNSSSNETNIEMCMSPRFTDKLKLSDDEWLAVSETFIYAEPTSAPTTFEIHPPILV